MTRKIGAIQRGIETSLDNWILAFKSCPGKLGHKFFFFFNLIPGVPRAKCSQGVEGFSFYSFDLLVLMKMCK